MKPPEMTTTNGGAAREHEDALADGREQPGEDDRRRARASVRKGTTPGARLMSDVPRRGQRCHGSLASSSRWIHRSSMKRQGAGACRRGRP
ncbi:hypothetical protein WME90_12125 [Sorangium sp. So ce375]|uniref:hypothetical protein n=1 Tax=Sorangium sp. So ce375 TaxID=3133306 RepID=UPI003F5B8FC7